jgi:hypothetical protein
MHTWIKNSSYPGIRYEIRVMLPLWLSECAVETWYEGHQYGRIEVDCARQVEIILIKIGESNNHQANPSADMIS